MLYSSSAPIVAWKSRSTSASRRSSDACGLLTGLLTGPASSRRIRRKRTDVCDPPSEVREPKRTKEDEMAEGKLNGKRVAILATDMVERAELVEPRKALEEAGATTELLSLEPGTIDAFEHFDRADQHTVDRLVEEADASEYDALMLPGGVGNPDQLRMDENAVSFVRGFFDA